MKRLSDAQLTEIRERCEKATEGPWTQMNASNVFTELGARNNLGVRADENDGWMIADTGEGRTLVEGNLYEMHANENKANATFIANARQDIPALLAEVEYAKYIVGEARSILHRAKNTIDLEYGEGTGISDDIYGFLSDTEEDA